jgi:RHS repeat-associated protein
VTAPGLAWSAVYNGDGARLRQVTNGTPTTYTLDLAAPLVTVLQAQYALRTTQYVYGQGDSPLASHDGTLSGVEGWTYLSGRDGLNSVRQETDVSGNVIAARGFDPYGVLMQGGGGSPFGYTGEAWDSATQLVFLRTRYFMPQRGRFLTRDVWPGDQQAPQTLHPYAYAQNRPIDLTDPSGLSPIYPTIGAVISFWEWAYSKDGWGACDILYKDDGLQLPTDTVGDLIFDYLCERGPDSRTFRASDGLTWDMARSALTDKIRRKFYRGELDQSKEMDFDMAEFWAATVDFLEIRYPQFPIPIAHFLGGWNEVKIVPEDGKSTRRLRWTIVNQTDRASGTHLPLRHQDQGYRQYLEDLVRKDPELALMPAGYEWTLPIISVLRPKSRTETSDAVTPKEGGGAYQEIFTWTEDYFCDTAGNFIGWPYDLDYLHIGR